VNVSREVKLLAGSAVADVTPQGSVFLFGYPNVSRWSTGVHDRLLASALYLSDETIQTLFIAVDIIFVSVATVRRVRQRISQSTSIPESHILISATHTHSGPITVDYLSNEHDALIPKVDAEYLRWFEDQLVNAGCRAVNNAESAQAGVGIANATGIGANRRDPAGAADLSAPVLFVQRDSDASPLALMLICSMHPTVLHENSTLISGDFPGIARQYLQRHVVGADCAVLYHTGPAGNQSPRHVVRSNTFEEAKRLGEIVGAAVETSIRGIALASDLSIECHSARLNFPLRSFDSVSAAAKKLEESLARLTALRESGASRATIRTAECDWFGAAETLTLAQAAADGRLAQFAESCMPAEVQLIRVGEWNFVGWPGEMFVEFGLRVKARHANTFIISYANGELQGYLVTQQAVDEGGYEASNALFKSPDSGNMLVDSTLTLLK
jgi:neutral/alkaline ceramidase-like enzyme